MMRKILLTALHKMKCQKGLGLIELMLALALLGLVLALGYSFFFFGTEAFDTGESRQNVQQNVRNLADAITDEVRFATNVDILSGVEDIPQNDGNYYIFIENDQLYFQDEDGDRSAMPGAVDDGTVIDSISFSGEGNRILEFTINASKNQQNYQVESSVEPLNLTGSIDGDDGGVAIGFGGQDIRMTASPNQITSRTYSELKITLDLINCELKDDIDDGDITLGDEFNGLDLDSVTKSSDTQFVITFVDDTEIDNTGEGTITINQDALSIDHDLTASVTVYEKEIDYIIVYGENYIYIPNEEDDENEEEYAATVYDQFEDEIKDESVTWSLEEAVTGVEIDENSGVVTVDDEAEEGKFTVVATSDTNGDIEGTLEVELLITPTLCGSKSKFSEERKDNEVVVTARDQSNEPINNLDIEDTDKWKVEEDESAQLQSDLTIDEILSDSNSNVYTIIVNNIQTKGDVGHVEYDGIEITEDSE